MKRCDFCGGRFGLVGHWYFWKRFCRKRCKENYLQARRTMRRHWLTFIPKPS